MITFVKTTKGGDALTSDQWHVVHARFMANGKSRPFHRSISSEHEDRPACVLAARALLAKLRADGAAVPAAERDQVFVRPPGFKSMKIARRRVRTVRRDEGPAA